MKSNHEKPVHTTKCKYCPQIFDRSEAICWRCGNCQGCGQLTPDKFGNLCIHCHNWIDQEPYNKRGPTITVRFSRQKNVRAHTPKGKRTLL